MSDEISVFLIFDKIICQIKQRIINQKNIQIKIF